MIQSIIVIQVILPYSLRSKLNLHKSNKMSPLNQIIFSIMSEDKSNWNMGFIVREMSEIHRDDSIFKLIVTDVLQIGKNIHFLRLLKKLYLLEDITNTGKYCHCNRIDIF